MGISTKAVLRLAGLPTQLFQQNRIWLTTEEMRALYDDVGYRDLSCYRATRVKTSEKIKTTFGRVLLCTPFSGIAAGIVTAAVFSQSRRLICAICDVIAKE